MTPFLRRAAVAILAAVVGLVGLIFGMRMRDRVSPPLSHDATVVAPAALAVGRTFPDVPVVAEDGRTVNTHDFLRGRGGVVMFIELGCPPCTTMMANWKRWAAEDRLEGIDVHAISLGSIDAVKAYKAASGFPFAVYADEAGRFGRDYAVTNFPMRLGVGGSLTILSFTYDSNEPARPERLRTLAAH